MIAMSVVIVTITIAIITINTIITLLLLLFYRGTMETVSDFIFLGSQITADGNCSHEIKRRLFLGRKIMTNLDGILKTKDITWLTNVHIVKTMVLPVVYV